MDDMHSTAVPAASWFPPGTTPIKSEYLISIEPRAIPDDDAAEGSTNPASSSAPINLAGEGDARSGGGKKLNKKDKKKKERGQNKGRRFQKVREDVDLCWRIARGTVCEFGETCRQSHDIPAYFASKPADLSIPPTSSLSTSPPFARPSPSRSDPRHPSLDLNTTCPVFAALGECRYGLKCRFLGGHVKIADKEEGESELEMVFDEQKKARAVSTEEEINKVDAEVLKKVRSKKYPTPIADEYTKEPRAQAAQNQHQNQKEETKTLEDGEPLVFTEPEQDSQAHPSADGEGDMPMKDIRDKEKANGHAHDPAQADAPDARIRFQEKKRLSWEGKTYLAPLTTTGNLPFRRLCVSLGAEITCGEMGLAMSFLQGSKEEWSLVRRHPDEKTFGVQLAGSRPNLLVPAAEILAKEFGNGGLDFVDLNCGCPIDLVFKQGSGSALLDAPARLGKILVGMNRALGEIPLTIKLRTGVKEGKNTVHKVMERAGAWGVGAMTLHGRTRQQRYTKLADWEYIKTCVEMVRAKEEEDDLPRIPIFGNGDVFSAQDYYERIEKYGVDGAMIGRGALIKPWIFTEIKERREWDITSRERLELVRRYAEYGLNHFGSDTAGVNTTRRYLCEALSFQYRYVPIGLLEVMPPRINDRPPAFRGRDELETLLASGDSRDWVRISEMFLGAAPEGWSFLPKHKSNAYGNEEAQG